MDLDGDGHPDLLSGSWPGEIYLFRGTVDRSFAPPELLKGKDGELINVGGGVRDYPGREGIIIRGTVKWETVDGRRFATYRGQRFEKTAEKPIATTGTASVVSVADWNGDGILDLVIGNIDGDVYVIPNEGTARAYTFGKEQPLKTTDGRPVHVASRAGPCAADWDGDGDLDLLVGAEDGSVTLHRNIGSKTAPRLAAALRLVDASPAGFTKQSSRDLQRGVRSKLCVADWNGDGKPDLLLGDLAILKPDRAEPTAEEKARQDRIRKELEPVQNRYRELGDKLYSATGEEREKLTEEVWQVAQQMQSLRSQLPRETETHGWAWLFLRK